MTDTLIIFTIYKNPRDYPDSWVLRAHEVLRDGTTRPNHAAFIGPTLESVRAAVPPDKICLGRLPADDPVIYESWI